MKVYRRVESGLARAAELSLESGDTLASPLLPGLSVPLTQLFAGA